jgi:hypothetical protein
LSFFFLLYIKGSLLSIVFALGGEMIHLNNKKRNGNPLIAQATIFTLAITIIMAASSMEAPAAATTTQLPPVTATTTTDNGSVNVLINWEPSEIEPNQETQFTLDFQDPSSGESIMHVNYNFEIKDENGETVQSMTDLHTHSGSDEQTVTFDTTGRFNLVVTIIGTGINPPFDTTQSGTAQTAITVGRQQQQQQQLPTTAATADGNNTTTDSTTTPTEATPATTTTTTSSSELELSPQPVYQELQKNVGEIPINQTHSQFTLSGNGTLTLPNATETINTTSTGSVVVSTLDGTAAGKEMLATEDGTENATATFYGIARFNMENGTGRGIIISLVHTNSTGRLAPLDGMILTGQIEFQPDQTGLLTLWEWQSGIPLPTGATTTTNTTATTTSELPPPSNVP